MNLLRIVLALGLLGSSANAQSFDLPRLSWPTDTTVVTSQGQSHTDTASDAVPK